MIQHGTGSYVLCSLQKSTLLQQPLNLEFAAGEEISFVINGTGTSISLCAINSIFFKSIYIIQFFLLFQHLLSLTI